MRHTMRLVLLINDMIYLFVPSNSANPILDFRLSIRNDYKPGLKIYIYEKRKTWIEIKSFYLKTVVIVVTNK